MGILDNCTPSQVEAITHINGPLLVVAGAGSGKTRVITRRIAYLIEQGIKPWKIAAITFTNKAAGEMKERVEDLVGTRGVWVSTFHSMCARMLRRFPEAIGYGRDFTIYDANDSLTAIKGVMKTLEIDSEHWTPQTVQSAISNAKNDMLSVEQFEGRASNFFDKVVAKVYRAYEDVLHQNQAVDFDDLLTKVAKLLSEENQFSEYWKSRFDYVLIDEYQDTNHAQYLIAKQLAERHRNICATGDPDQSIYGWRGADIRNILDFVEEYQDAKVVKLEENFRSTGSILKAAEQVIVNNSERIERALFTNKGEGSKVRLMTTFDEDAEAEAVVTLIRKLRNEGYSYGDMAIFYRTNFQSRSFERILSLQGVPYTIVGTVEFYNRKEIKDILSYLRVLVNNRDDLSMMRIINTPPRGIGGQTLLSLQSWAAEQGISLMEAVLRCEEIDTMSSRAQNAVLKFKEIIEKLIVLDAPVPEVVEQVVKLSGYLEWLRNSKDDLKEEREENLGELVSSAARYLERTPDGNLQGFLEEVALVSQIDEYDDGSDRVTLMTVHAAKGLEFPVVFITGAEEGLFPHQNSMETISGVEEERRLCYVAITRAQKELFITRAGQRMRFGMTMEAIASRFLDELPDEVVVKLSPYGEEVENESESQPPLIETRRQRAVAPDRAPSFEPDDTFNKGDDVRHPTFGRGTIIERSGSGSRATVMVRFPGVGVKRLMLEYAKLEKV